jgi:ABC-type uncharacterized transport system auxiliary subunit
MIRNRPLLTIVAALLLLPGCFRTGGKAPAPEERFILEYPFPVLSGAAPIAGAIRIGRFGGDEPLKTTLMAYRPSAFRMENDFYNRWVVSPESLVTGFLLRDFRRCGPFPAVFAEGEPQPERFLLHGYLESFEEIDGSKGREASLAATVTLLDLSRKEIPERLLFQKAYRVAEPLAVQTAEGYAQAMSRAMERFSTGVVKDVFEATRRREREEKGP